MNKTNREVKRQIIKIICIHNKHLKGTQKYLDVKSKIKTSNHKGMRVQIHGI